MIDVAYALGAELLSDFAHHASFERRRAYFPHLIKIDYDGGV